MHLETIALHAGFDGDTATRALAVPVYQTAAFEFESAEHAAALFNLEAEGFRYSRISNPTTTVLEKRLAALEGGAGALCLGSGQAALYNVVLSLAEAGGTSSRYPNSTAPRTLSSPTSSRVSASPCGSPPRSGRRM